MPLGKAASTVLRVLCAAVVLTASNLILLSSFFPVKHAVAATELRHEHFSNHVARTLPHSHDVDSSHSHSHGVPAPDGVTPLAKSLPDGLEGMALVLVPWALLRVLRKVVSGSDESGDPRALATCTISNSLSPNACVQALILAPQAPPLLAH